MQINLAAYYCLCDLVLIWQWWYYGKYYSDGAPISVRENEEATNASENTPLLSNSASTAQGRIVNTFHEITQRVKTFFDALTPTQFATLKYSVTLGFVLVTGVIAWFSANESDFSGDALYLLKKKKVVLRWDAQVLGWLSALLYIVSRVPQIFKNRHTKCAGLSLALFVFAVGGNVTYVLVRFFCLTASLLF